MRITRLILLVVLLSLALVASPRSAHGVPPMITPTPTPPPVGPPLFAAKINFQPAGVPTPAGYLADTGAVYGSRGNGYTYGWSTNNSANMRDRNAVADQRYDTLVHTQLNGSFRWEIAVPNGRYTVRVVAGDANYFNSFYHTLAEGWTTVHRAPTSSLRWHEGSEFVNVTDGKLTVTNGADAVNNKIAFIEITQHWSVKINFQPAGAGVPAGYLADTGLPFGNRGNGYTYGWSADNQANMRERNMVSDQRFDTLAHMQLNGSFSWSLVVPNGTYDVVAFACDPAYFNSVYSIDINGWPLIRETPTSGDRSAGVSLNGLRINNGRLTLTNGAGAVNNKLCFVEAVGILAEPRLFEDDFNRPDSPDVGPNWVPSGWEIRGGTAYTFERGFARLITAQAFPAPSYVIETRALGFGPTQGASPSDSLDLVFGGADLDIFSMYRVIYFYSNPFVSSNTGLLMLERVEQPIPNEPWTSTVLDKVDIRLPTNGYLKWKVVRDGPSGLIQVFIDMGEGYYQPVPLLEATDTTYTSLGHFGWILESEAPGDFNVDWITAIAR